MAPDNKNKRKSIVINRYGWIVMTFLLVFIVIFIYIIRIMFVEGDQWRALGERETIKRDREITPVRGNIYACDGRLLAISEPLYGVYMDFMADGIKKDTLMKYVGELSKELAKKFPEKNAAQYKKTILDGWVLSRKETEQIARARAEGSDRKIQVKSRHIRLIKRDINYIELKELLKLPFLNQRSNRSGLYTEERSQREKPFGRLAGRTIGSIYKDAALGGASGVELKYDSILRGKPGIKSRQKIQGRWIDIVEVPAVDGWDVVTTIDVDIQDITENALRDKLIETGAESGTAIVMEVSTGEIKAISNLDRQAEGLYAEGNPNAFSYMSEPGSTFKTLSMMIALEDGVVRPEDKFHVGNGLFQYKGKWVRDHYWQKGKDMGDLTVNEGMYYSSNILLAKTILKGYENDPTKFVQRLHDLGVTRKIDWDVPLKGKEGTAVIRFPDDKANHWSKTTLPWMSFGYETQIPPIYMLMFYNGIANNGKMVKPFTTKAFLKGGKTLEEFTTEIINPAMCSERTLNEIKSMLIGVINDKLGTGKVVKCDAFQVAGKTGTAQIATGGGYSGHYVSFCGYFPAEAPKYTIFVGIRKPKGLPSAGLMPGGVFKRIAEEVYSRNTYITPKDCPIDSTLTKTPYAKDGRFDQIEKVLIGLKIPYKMEQTGAEWIRSNTADNSIELRKATIHEGTIPDVTGMGAKDALYALEKSGLKVAINGYGKVRTQSIPAGSRAVKGAHISLELK